MDEPKKDGDTKTVEAAAIKLGDYDAKQHPKDADGKFQEKHDVTTSGTDSKPTEASAGADSGEKKPGVTKAVVLPPEVVQALSALAASVSNILAGQAPIAAAPGVPGAAPVAPAPGTPATPTPPAAAPAATAPSQPAQSQGMAPENRVPDKEPDNDPDDNDPRKKPAMKSETTDSIKAMFDGSVKAAVEEAKAGFVKTIAGLEERIKVLEATPAKPGPVLNPNNKAASNSKMDDGTPVESAIKSKVYQDILDDPNTDPTTRMAIGRKAAMLDLDGLIANGPQHPNASRR
jgi:hypothetical protein